MSRAPFLTGQFLVATPGMTDPRFRRSVIAMCAHDENGALGINIGDVSDTVDFRAMLREFDMDRGDRANRAVYLGGPVEQQRGFILHSLDYASLETVQVADRWGMSSSLDLLKMIATGDGPERWAAALGYAGWGGGQLENELTRNGWTSFEGDPDWIFDDPEADKWQLVWDRAGIDPGHLSGEFGSA